MLEKKNSEPSFAVLTFVFPQSVYLIVDVQGNVYVCFYQMVCRHFDHFIMSYRSPVFLRH